jgi:hypothetical protein
MAASTSTKPKRRTSKAALARYAVERKALRAQAREFEATADQDALERIIRLFGKENGGRFSVNNCLLILMQRPDATDIRTFGQWLQAGRAPRKGEAGIRLWQFNGKAGEEAAAEPEPEDSTEGEDTGEGGKPKFKLYSAFDITQTGPAEAKTTAPAPAAKENQT